jgi:hypothetical protein
MAIVLLTKSGIPDKCDASEPHDAEFNQAIGMVLRRQEETDADTKILEKAWPLLDFT